MKPVLIKPSGEVILSFSDSIKPIYKVYDRNLNKKIKLSIYSHELQKTIVGKWKPKPSGKNPGKRGGKRKLTSTSEDVEDIFNDFGWFVSKAEDDSFII
jgi:hypothetical protein